MARKTTKPKNKKENEMDQKQMMKQMLEMNKIACDNTFMSITTIQEQTENMTQKMIDQATWLPEEGKKAIDEWLATYKKGREDFKKLVDDAFGKVLQSF
jgi:DNA-binding ferritin-like protein